MKTVALFPGQGSQYVGMMKELHAEFAVARATFEEASDAIRLRVDKLCFDGPEGDLTLTENTQPALLTASIAAFRVLQETCGLAPAAVAGHSLGEYSALVAAGAFSLSSAVQWVKARGRAMQSAVPAGLGGMAAILVLDEPAIERLCKQATQSAREKAHALANESAVETIVEPANFNAPGQVVIAGSRDAIDEAVALCRAEGKTGGAYAGAKAIPLQVSAPFHCKLMKPAREKMHEIFKAAKTPAALACPYVPNRTARLSSEAAAIFDLLVEQVDHPVLWSQSIAGLAAGGYTNYVEVGPGKVLTGLLKRISRDTLGANVQDLATLKAFEESLKGKAPA